MENFPIDLTNVYCYWYGFEKYINLQQKDIRFFNLPENHVEHLWLEQWFAKNQKQKDIDRKLQIYKDFILDCEQNFENISREKLWEKFSLLILFDQISRNIFRGSEQAYRFDCKARILCFEILGRFQSVSSVVRELPLHNVISLVLVLVHSEKKGDQDMAAQIIRDLKEFYGNKFSNVLINLSLISDNHKERVEMFGRIPERNRYLLRDTTEKEGIYLKQVDSRNIQ